MRIKRKGGKLGEVVGWLIEEERWEISPLGYRGQVSSTWNKARLVCKEESFVSPGYFLCSEDSQSEQRKEF